MTHNAENGLPAPVRTPGDLLAVLARDRGVTQAELASQMGRPAQMVSEVRTGRKRLTAHTARQLERALGVPAGVWLAFQNEVDLRDA